MEAAIISTGNRTGIYYAFEHIALDHTFGWLAESGGVAPTLLRSHAYTLHDDEAARHVFRPATFLTGAAQTSKGIKNKSRETRSSAQ